MPRGIHAMVRPLNLLRTLVKRKTPVAGLIVTAITISMVVRLWPMLRLTSSELAAWVQAIGSIVAIGIAVRVVQMQHANTIAHSAELDRRSQKRSLNRLIITLQTIATAASEVSSLARRGSLISADLESAYLLEARRRLLEIPSSDIPDVALLAKVDTILLKLHRLGYTCKWLNKDRPQKVRDAFAESLEHLGRLCFLAICDGANLLNNICTKREVDADWRMIDEWKENHKRSLSILNEIGLTSFIHNQRHSRNAEDSTNSPNESGGKDKDA
jgi:hypothetical protein